MGSVENNGPAEVPESDEPEIPSSRWGPSFKVELVSLAALALVAAFLIISVVILGSGLGPTSVLFVLIPGLAALSLLLYKASRDSALLHKEIDPERPVKQSWISVTNFAILFFAVAILVTGIVATYYIAVGFSGLFSRVALWLLIPAAMAILLVDYALMSYTSPNRPVAPRTTRERPSPKFALVSTALALGISIAIRPGAVILWIMLAPIFLLVMISVTSIQKYFKGR